MGQAVQYVGHLVRTEQPAYGQIAEVGELFGLGVTDLVDGVEIAARPVEPVQVFGVGRRLGLERDRVRHRSPRTEWPMRIGSAALPLLQDPRSPTPPTTMV
jgi:hypothetical protein